MMETSTEKAERAGFHRGGNGPEKSRNEDHPRQPYPGRSGRDRNRLADLAENGKVNRTVGLRRHGQNRGPRTLQMPGNQAVKTAGTVAGKAKQIVGQARERAQEAVGQAREKAGQVFEQARERAGQLGTATRQKARALKERSRGLLEERPFLIAAAALGAGVILGSPFPSASVNGNGWRELTTGCLAGRKGVRKRSTERPPTFRRGSAVVIRSRGKRRLELVIFLPSEVSYLRGLGLSKG